MQHESILHNETDSLQFLSNNKSMKLGNVPRSIEIKKQIHQAVD